jgi:glyoxylate reductase
MAVGDIRSAPGFLGKARMPNKKPQVIVTRRLPDAIETRMMELFDCRLRDGDQPMDQAEMVQASQECDVLVPTVTDRIDAAILSQAGPDLKLIASFGTGVDHIDLKTARERGITVTNTPGVLTEDTADMTMAMLLALPRRLSEGERLVRAEAWTGWGPTSMLGQRIWGKRLGIIGMGRIGTAMARRCFHALDMEVVFYDVYPVADAGVPARQLATIDEVLQVADFVSLHCTGGDDNMHLINAERLSQMKPTAFLINSARGDIVDEVALVAALQAGTIAGAGLDVFESEPAITEALTTMANVCLLPHLGSATIETREAMGMTVVENLTAFFDGREPSNRVV